MVFGAFLRFRITDKSKPGPDEADSVGVKVKVKGHKKRPLLTISQLPSWYDANPFILSGYRPESRSWWLSLASWTYSHNETGNIYSHMIPGVVLLVLLGQGWLYEHVRARHEVLSELDWMVLALQVLSGTACLFVSALYHTALNHSEGVATRWLQLDYVGIVALILGDFISGLHFGFYCMPGLKYFYWGVIVTLGFATVVVHLSPRFSGPEYRLFRLGCFIGTGLSAFAPIAHVWILRGPRHVWGIGVPYYLLEGVLLLIGCYFWERRMPERIYPGRFDIWGHSHTIWHVFVTLSIGAHIWGLLSAMDYTYKQGCPFPTSIQP